MGKEHIYKLSKKGKIRLNAVSMSFVVGVCSYSIIQLDTMYEIR